MLKFPAMQPHINPMRRVMLWIFFGQSLMALLAVGLWFWLGGAVAAITALSGALTSIIPNFGYAMLLYFATKKLDARQFMYRFYLGEFFKLVLTAILLVSVVKLLSLPLLPVITGMLAVQLGVWVVPLMGCM